MPTSSFNKRIIITNPKAIKMIKEGIKTKRKKRDTTKTEEKLKRGKEILKSWKEEGLDA